MAAWHCPQCDDNYPNTGDYNYCPVCGTYTKPAPSATLPDVPLDVAQARVRAKENREAFEKWLADHKWDESHETVHITIYGERRRPTTRLERNAAARIAYMLDELVSFVNGESGPGSGGPVAPLGELHVFHRG